MKTMKDKDDIVVTLIGDKGEKIICDVLFTYYSEEYDKHYVVFTPRGTSECSAGYYIEKNGSFEVSEITNEAEWKMLDKVLDEYYNNEK